MHLRPTELFWNVSIIKLDESMQSKVFLTCGEIDDKGCRDVRESVEFIGLAEVDHVPDQALFVGDFSVELEVIEAEAVLAELVVLEPKGVLRPLQEDSFMIGGFYQSDPLRKCAFDSLVIIPLAKVIVSDVIVKFLDGLHLRPDVEQIVGLLIFFDETF